MRVFLLILSRAVPLSSRLICCICLAGIPNTPASATTGYSESSFFSVLTSSSFHDGMCSVLLTSTSSPIYITLTDGPIVVDTYTDLMF